MNTKTLIGGGAGLVVLGLLLGWLFDGGDRKMRRGLEEMRETTAALSEQVKTLKDSAGETAAQVAELASSQEGMTSRLDEMQEGVAAQMAEMKDGLAANADSLRDELASSTASLREDLGGQITAASAAAAAAVPAAAPAAEAPQATAAAKPVAAAGGSSESTSGATAGQTVKLGDALRVFIGRVDSDAKEAYAAVNGVVTQRFRQDRPVAVDTAEGLCTLTLTDTAGGGAGFESACGDAVQAPEGVSVGETMIFDNGPRVFVSRLDQGEGTAMVAVNGQATRAISYDDSLSVNGASGRCDLMLDNIDRGHATLSLACAE